MNNDLRNLLLATNLGKSRDHPSAGWNILTILYGNRASADIPRTLGFLVEQYNANYLDTQNGESLITDAVIKNVLKTLEEDAKFIEVSPRKIRVRMTSGAYHMQNAPVYRITSRGIEYLSMLPKVLDAESTVTANTARIKEYCSLLNKLNSKHLDATHTQLFNDFNNMVSAYSDVMKGMHKLSEDLDEVSNDLAFNHGGKIAEHLNQMLTEKAVPAYMQLISQGSVIQDLNRNSAFPDQVARSRQGEDSLEIDQAVDNQTKLSVQIHRDRDYVKTQLQDLSNSFDPTSTGIDSNFDSIYLIFNTIKDSIDLLSDEYDHINAQTIDIKHLTKQIDELLTHYQNIKMPVQLPRHLAEDREVSDANDLLEAGTLGPVIYQANAVTRQVATVEDNPEIASDDEIIEDYAEALKEFQNLVMVDDKKGRVDRNLELEHLLTRDEIIRLYSATNYDYYKGFAPFGRPVKSVKKSMSHKQFGYIVKMSIIAFNYQVDFILIFKESENKMTVQLNHPERLVINQLLDTGLFTSKPSKPTNEVENAVRSMRRPQFQKRINTYLKDLIGVTPENVQENVLLLFGSNCENSDTVHVLLATLKAVINLPELQANQKDRSVLTQTIIRQVHSEVVDLDEKEIRRIINQLFVDRFKLFTLDYPEFTQNEQNQEVTEYWNVSSSFNQVAQAIVNQLTNQSTFQLTDEQKLNRLLLNERFISREANFTLWNYLINHKDSVSQAWKNLDRFDLEIGDGYALLLDTKRQQVKSKPSFIAIAVAKAMHTGITEDNLNGLIKNQIKMIFPKNSIAISQVKEALTDFGLITIKNDFVFPTPLIQRFAIEKVNRSNDDE